MYTYFNLLSTDHELINYFYEFLSEKSHKSNSAIHKITLDLKKFVEKIDNTLISSDSISDYIFWLKDKYNPSTYKVKLSSLRQFCSWLDLKDNPFYYANDFEVIEDEDKDNGEDQRTCICIDTSIFLATPSAFSYALITPSHHHVIVTSSNVMIMSSPVFKKNRSKRQMGIDNPRPFSLPPIL